LPGSKVEQAPGANIGGQPGAYMLVHHVVGGRKVMFPPTRLMNPVTYLGRTPQNDLVLRSDNVSRRHAKLIVTDMGVTVHDLDSHNGIFLNGKKVRSTPLNVGDLLYVADVCIEIRKSPDAEQFAPSSSSSRIVQHNEITGEEDPSARNLATLVRAAETLATAGDDQWATNAIELCRELTEANVAVLVFQTNDGLLETPVVLQPENGRRGEVPALWPLVRKALDDGLAQFSADLKRQPIIDDESVRKSDVGAVCVVPIVVENRAEGVIYLARPTPSPVFTERELETVAAIAQMFALRRRPADAVAVESVDAVAPQGDALALQAKAEAAEERLAAAQADVRSLTERIHGLEADALKLKQQLEIERQNAVDAKREADRGRMEASKLEQGLHKTDEDVKKLKDALARSEEERAKLREATKAADEERRARNTELERLREALKTSEHDREALRGEIADHVRSAQERDDEIQRLTTEVARLSEEARVAQASQAEAAQATGAAVENLKATLRSIVPTSVVEHIEAVADEGGAPTTDVAVRPVAALYVTVRGFDSWAAQATPADVKARLDQICSAVALRAKANGGRVEQVLGHAHLVLFPADAASVRAAVRCGLEIAALVPEEGGVGIASALHVGPSGAGFFGDGETATRVEVGEALAVARGVVSAAWEPTFLVTDAVQRLIAGDTAFTLALVGPVALLGAPSVVLFKAMSSDGRSA
jgi:class 3 adenylate cyclase/GAF domain-containing protein